MAVSALGKLDPVEVFHYFEEINNIPRGSGNEKAVSDYLVSFAKAHNLDVTQDLALNVVMKKPGTAGYENSPGVVLQGHMDMVCEKAPGIAHDFLKDPIQMQVKGDMVYAAGTTLGADDGIAVAMGLAVMAANDIPHPPLELLVTTNEETGMDGAHALDAKTISGRTLINVDSEEEGILTVSCAGGCTAKTNIAVAWETLKPSLTFFTVKIDGLKGGHSGQEINKGRANANKLLGRFLEHVNGKMELVLCSASGGSKHNAIARDAQAVVGINKKDEELLRGEAAEFEKIYRNEFHVADPDIRIHMDAAAIKPDKAMSKKDAANLICFLYLIPNSVQAMSMDIEGLVETSLNLGVVETKENSVEVISSIRSAVATIKDNLFHTVVVLAGMCNGSVTVEGAYPEWRYNPDSKIRDVISALYEKQSGKKPLINSIHAGLECAIFDQKFAGKMDLISLGPTMIGVHTAEEHLSISSTKRTWELLKETLKALR